LVQSILTLVDPPFLEGNALATPGAAQCVGRGSNSQGVDHRNIRHGPPPFSGVSNFTIPRPPCHPALSPRASPIIMALAAKMREFLAVRPPWPSPDSGLAILTPNSCTWELTCSPYL
jgi:hypothetical protein